MVQSETLTLWWQLSNCCTTRSSSLPSRVGLVCAFCCCFLKLNNNFFGRKSAAVIRTERLCLIPRINVVSILRGELLERAKTIKSCLSLECSFLSIRNSRSWCGVSKRFEDLKFSAMCWCFSVLQSSSHWATHQIKFRRLHALFHGC